MSILFLILPITLVLSAGAVAAFAWATRSGQFDDLETPAIRLLHDESGRERQNEKLPGAPGTPVDGPPRSREQ